MAPVMAPVFLQGDMTAVVNGAFASVADLAVRLDGTAQSTPIGASLAYTATGAVTGGFMLGGMMLMQRWANGKEEPSETSPLVDAAGNCDSGN